MAKNNIDEATKNRKKGGRPTDPEMQKIILDCIEKGLGYKASVPVLMEHGYQKYNKCIVTKRQFDYVQIKYSSTKVIRIKTDTDTYLWAQDHKSEILNWIKERMKEDKFRIENIGE